MEGRGVGTDLWDKVRFEHGVKMKAGGESDSNKNCKLIPAHV